MAPGGRRNFHKKSFTEKSIIILAWQAQWFRGAGFREVDFCWQARAVSITLRFLLASTSLSASPFSAGNKISAGGTFFEIFARVGAVLPWRKVVGEFSTKKFHRKVDNYFCVAGAMVSWCRISGSRFLWAGACSFDHLAIFCWQARHFLRAPFRPEIKFAPGKLFSSFLRGMAPSYMAQGGRRNFHKKVPPKSR